MGNESSYDKNLTTQIGALGDKLRKIRQAKSLNLITVAKGCGVSTSLLSQVERGIVIPSLNTLYSLCNFYEVSLFELFAEDNNSEIYKIVTKDERRTVTFAGSPNVYELVSPASVTSVSVLEMIVGHRSTDNKAVSSEAVVRHTHEECVLVQEGELEIQLGDQVVRLKEGDSVYYNGATPHEFISVGDTAARVLLITVPAV